MPASLLAHSGKKGTSAPSAKPAQKNSKRPSSAGRGSPRQEDEIVVMMSPTRQRPEGPDGALADVNAYGRSKSSMSC